MKNKLKIFINFLKTEKGISLLLLFLAILFNIIFLYPEIKFVGPNINDEIYQQLSVQEAGLVLQHGQDPTDFWFSKIELGLPLFHHYQHLPQLFLTIVNQAFSLFFPLSRLFDLFRYLFLILFPLSIFWAMRRFGFSYLAAGLSALICSFLSTNNLFGIDYNSYVWRGSGIYTQLWGMFFLPLALAEIYQKIRGKGHLFWPVFLSIIVMLSHVFYGYILFLSSIIFIFLKLDKKEFLKRFKRLVLIFIFIALVTAYFTISVISDIKYVNHSINLPSWKWDSFGAKNVLHGLFSGDLFDFNRFPSLTILFLISFVYFFIFKSYKKEKYRLLFVLTIVWLLIFFGKPFWGSFLNLLPFNRMLQFHRFIGAFHIFAVMLTGVGLSLIFKKIKKSQKVLFLTVLIVILLFLPVFNERIGYYKKNKILQSENQQAFQTAEQELLKIKKTIENLPPGRLYVGIPDTFGNDSHYKIGIVPLYSIFTELGLDVFGYAYHVEALIADLRLQFNDTRPDHYNLFNVRYILLHKDWSPAYYYSEIKKFENYILYEAPTTGYFDLVSAPAVFYGKTKDFYMPNSKWLSGSLPLLKQHPILNIANEPQMTFGLPVFSFKDVDKKILNDFSQNPSITGKILNEKIEINKYQVQFKADQNGYLILKTNYDPGWQTYLDDKKVSSVMLAPGFVGLKVPPGTHQAVFLYKAPVYRFPLLIFGIFVLGLLFFYREEFLIDKRCNPFLKSLKIKYKKRILNL